MRVHPLIEAGRILCIDRMPYTAEMRASRVAIIVLSASLCFGCDEPAESSPPPEPEATASTPSTPPPEPATPPEPAQAETVNAVRVVSSDGDWNVLSIFDDTYHVTFPGTFEWDVEQEDGYTAYHAAELYQGRMYTIWVHRHEPGSRGLADPNRVDDACAAFGLTSGAVAAPRMDLTVAGGLAQGRAARYTHETNGLTYYNHLVVFRVLDDIVFHAVTSRPDYGPIDHFRRMNDGFSLAPPSSD